MKKIVCRIQDCMSCRSCELACAVAHSQSQNLIGALQEEKLPQQRIRIEYIDGAGTLQRTRGIAVQCRHCQDALCVQACIAGGIRKDEKSGETVMDPSKCVGCWSCVMVCPVGAIVVDEKGHRALKCDHCHDLPEPACVTACPTGALLFLEEEENPTEVTVP